MSATFRHQAISELAEAMRLAIIALDQAPRFHVARLDAPSQAVVEMCRRALRAYDALAGGRP